MIYRLRKKFIKICMASFLAVFIALIASVFLINHFQTAEQLDQLADLISDNGGKFPAFDDIPRGENKPDRFRPGGLNKESPFQRVISA